MLETALASYMKETGVSWVTVVAHARMSNDGAERVLGTLRQSIRKMVILEKIEWDDAIRRAIFGYRRRPFRDSVSLFELLYGVGPRMHQDTKTTNNSLLAQ